MKYKLPSVMRLRNTCLTPSNKVEYIKTVCLIAALTRANDSDNWPDMGLFHTELENAIKIINNYNDIIKGGNDKS